MLECINLNTKRTSIESNPLTLLDALELIFSYFGIEDAYLDEYDWRSKSLVIRVDETDSLNRNLTYIFGVPDAFEIARQVANLARENYWFLGGAGFVRAQQKEAVREFMYPHSVWGMLEIHEAKKKAEREATNNY